MHLHFVPNFHSMFVGMISPMADDITEFDIANFNHFGILARFLVPRRAREYGPAPSKMSFSIRCIYTLSLTSTPCLLA